MRIECGIWIAECGMNRKRSFARHGRFARHSAFRLPPSAFTLVELLVVVSIVAVLAGLLLGVAGVAAETGREARTKQMITRLHTLVMEHYDTFREKRVSLRDDYELQLTNAGFNLPSNSGQRRAIGRLAGARERMKMEMPDRWSDFVPVSFGDGNNDGGNALPVLNNNDKPAFLEEFPPLAQVFRTQYARMQANGVTAGALLENQSAECLYMIVMYAAGDGEARGLFKETDFGDTDGDGALEILDGWGNPIRFIRWAPGFVSDLQLSPARLDQMVSDSENDPLKENLSPEEVVVQAIDADHDPLDLFRMDQPLDGNNPFVTQGDPEDAVRGYRLIPLIFSAGRDEEYQLRVDSWFDNLKSDPYSDSDTKAEIQLLGEPLSAEATDNITNHLIQAE